MGEIYADMPSTSMYNDDTMLTKDSMTKTPWATPGNGQDLQSNAKRRKTQKMNITRRKGNSRDRIRAR